MYSKKGQNSWKHLQYKNISIKSKKIEKKILFQIVGFFIFLNNQFQTNIFYII